MGAEDFSSAARVRGRVARAAAPASERRAVRRVMGVRMGRAQTLGLRPEFGKTGHGRVVGQFEKPRQRSGAESGKAERKQMRPIRNLDSQSTAWKATGFLASGW